jgi:hypothetical protein
MPTVNDFATPGKVFVVRDGAVVFKPKGTNYELQLEGKFEGALDSPIELIIRATARKIWTVPSGGNFIEPIFGRPRIVQGRVKFIDQNMLVVQAGANFIIELPAADSGIDLAEGAIALNRMVNCTVLRGATFELAGQPRAR